MDDRNRDAAADYKRYEELIFERDSLEKEAGQTAFAYTRVFGKLTADIYEEKIEGIKLRKMIAFYQAAAARGEQADVEALITQLQQEMAEYYANLRQMLRRNELAERRLAVTEYEEERITSLYRHIAGRLHPDLHPETRENARLMELWTAAVTAYHASELKRLVDVEILTQKALKGKKPEVQMGLVEVTMRIEALEEEIAEIRAGEPYCWKELLADEAARLKKLGELEAELAQHREYRRGLEGVLNGLMDAGCT